MGIFINKSFKLISMKKKHTCAVRMLCKGGLILFALLSVMPLRAGGAENQTSKMTLTKSDVTIQTVMKDIEQATGFSFLYNGALVNTNTEVSVNVKNASLEQVLATVFKNSGITYSIVNNQIILSVASKTEGTKSVTQERTITGVIKDNTGFGMPGVNIMVKGTSNGTITDIDGNYSLNVPENATLVFSYVGYLPQEIQVGTSKTVNVLLKEDTKTLDEVVVIGYGKMKKGDLSAAVSTVSNIGALQERPISSAEEMLQGQIPGVTVVSNGGHPDSKPSITIRGMGSRNGETPLYVVDGVPGAPFNFSDVTSMTVLKDAASAAIYGAYAGSAGVILVTTKQAAPGRTSLEYSVVTGISTPTNLPQSLTIEEERLVRAKALGGEANLPAGWDANKNPYIGQTRTDWVDAIFRNAPFQRHNVALSGGTEDFSNRASVEFANRQGTLIDTYSKEVTLRLNSMYKLNKYIRIREDLSWQNTQSRGANTDSAESGVILSALMMPRNAEVYNADGSFGGTAPKDADYIKKYGSNYSDIHGDVINPVRTLSAATNENNLSRLTSSTFLDIMEPIKGLNFTSRFTFKTNNYFDKEFTPRTTEPGKPDSRNHLDYESSRSTDWDIENTLTYDRIFRRHNIGLMASTTASQYKYRDYSIRAENFASEEEALQYFAQAGKFNPAQDSYEYDRNVSFVGRASYSWSDRYFVTGSWRRDYAGRLPKGEKYGDFPSATVAWKLSSEPFMPKTEVLNTLKLRASWGRIGNLGSINRGYSYPNLSNFLIGDGSIGGQVGINTPTIVGKYVSAGFNPHLTWETSEQLDFGLDMTMFNNRLNVTADYFIKKTKSLIKEQDAGWTSSIGISPMLVNDGEIHNSGFELSIGWSDRAGKVDYWVNGNLATLKNRVYYIGEAEANGEKPVWTDGANFKELEPFRSKEGEPLYSFWLVESAGVFKSQAEVDNHVDSKGNRIQPDAQVGDLKFIDQNGDGEINDDDRKYMGNAMPKLTYSLSGGLKWNNFTFNMMLQGVAGVKIFNAYKYATLNESLGSFNRSNEILKALNGPCDEVPRISADDDNGNFSTNSDYYLEKGDYLRIKNISLGYSFTKLFRKCNYLAERNSSLDLTFSIDNLATFTSYSGIDPEVGSTPDSDTYSYGMDRGQYPVSRTYSIALKFKF